MGITDILVFCPKCSWWGRVGDCEPDVDDEGSIGCPRCKTVVEDFPGQWFKHN